MRIPSLGNPLKSEVAAFRWLVAVLIAAVAVGIVAKIISSTAAVILALALIVIAAVPIFRGIAHMLGSPDEDQR